MSIQMTKTWFVDGKIIEKKIPESEIYARPWNIEECKAYAVQLRDKKRANTAEHAAEAIEYLLSALQKPIPHAVIATTLFDFMGYLTSREERLVLSSADEASPAVDAIRDFAKMRGLSLDDAKVQDWNTTPHPAQQEPVAHVIDNGTPEGVTEWIPFTNRVEPLKTGDFLYATPPPCPTCGAAHRIEREAAMRKEVVRATVVGSAETNMSEYIQGFNAGYAYVLEQIERHPNMTVNNLLQYLKDDVEQKSQLS